MADEVKTALVHSPLPRTMNPAVSLRTGTHAGVAIRIPTAAAKFGV